MANFANATLQNLSGHHRHPYSWTTALACSYAIILVLGVAGNSTVVLVVYKYPKMKTPTNLFILNLAGANVLVDLVCVSLTLIYYYYPGWLQPGTFCSVVPFILGVYTYVFAYFLVAISADRCKVFLGSVGHRHGFSDHCAKLVVAGIWILAVLMSLPYLLATDAEISGQTRDFDFLHCIENSTSPSVHFIAAHWILGFAIPVLAVLTLNSVSVCKTRAVQQVSQAQPVTILSITRRLWILGFMFFLSWAPTIATFTQLYSCGTAEKGSTENSGVETEESYIQAVQLVGYISTCINPLFTAVCNKKFYHCVLNLHKNW